MTDMFFEMPRSKRDRSLSNYFFDLESGTPVDVRLAPPFGSRKNVAMRDRERVSLYSGGGGLVSNAVDFARFEEAMHNGVSLNGTSILGPKIVTYMPANHLSADSGLAGFGEQPGVDAVDTGVGSGLGFGVVTSAVKNAVIGSVGEYNWGGAAGTVFWIDPVEELVVVSMIQLMNSPWPLRADLKVAVHQALDDIYQ